MFFIKRKARLTFLYLLLALLTTQCGAEEQPAKPAVVQSATVRWTTWDLNSQVEQVLVKQFRETYPQIEFKREETSAAATFYLSKPPAPDILNMDVGYKLNIAIAKVQRVMETWKRLFDQGYFIEARMAIGDLYALTALVRGDKGMMHQAKAVMVLSDTYWFGQLPVPFQAELGFFSFPVIDASLPTAEIVDPFGYVVPLGAEHIPAAMAFLTQVSSVEAQGLIAQNEMVQSARFAPARTDIAADQLTPTQQQAVEMLKRADDAVMSFYYAVPRQMSGMVEYTFRHFINEPKDIDGFLQKFEEARQKMVEQGLLGQE